MNQQEGVKMAIELVHIGFDNFVAANRIVAIASINSTSIKRAIKEAQKNSLLIDLTHGRKTRTAIVIDTNHICMETEYVFQTNDLLAR